MARSEIRHATGDRAIRPSLASNLAIASDGSVRFGTADSGLICVGPNGTERWRVDDHGALAGRISLDAADVTLAIDQSAHLLAIDGSGDVVWRVPVEEPADAAPVLGADGTIYVVTNRGSLQAWR